MLARPAAGLDLRAAEIRLGEAAEGKQIPKVVASGQPELGCRQGMQAQQVVAALERVAAEVVHVEARASGHQDTHAFRPCVIQTLQVVAPAPVLVDLVEHPQPGWR